MQKIPIIHEFKEQQLYRGYPPIIVDCNTKKLLPIQQEIFSITIVTLRQNKTHSFCGEYSSSIPKSWQGNQRSYPLGVSCKAISKLFVLAFCQLPNLQSDMSSNHQSAILDHTVEISNSIYSNLYVSQGDCHCDQQTH